MEHSRSDYHNVNRRCFFSVNECRQIICFEDTFRDDSFSLLLICSSLNGVCFLQHEERLSRVFDEVMGLGDFAESSRGSATSSRSGGPEDPKGADETSGQGEEQPMEEEDSDGSKQEEKMEEGTGESSSPPITSSSSFAIRTNDGGGSGSAAFDDALDGLPVSGPEEDEDEDWHFALPMGSLEDVDVKKKNKNKPKTEKDQTYSSPPEPPVREDDESTDSANTSHSSRHRSPDNSRGRT